MKKELIGRTPSRQNDLYHIVTNKIIEALEKGIEPWRKTWDRENEGLPVNAATGRCYSGINVMLLWLGAVEKGVNSNRWLTFNQARCAGGRVRRGEKSTLVTLFKPFTEDSSDSETEDKLTYSSRCFMAHFHLFNINLEEKWIHLCEEGAKNHREHRVPIVSALYPSLENLVKEAQKVGVEPTDQVFNVGWFDLMKRKKHPKSMGEYPLRSFFKRLSAECHFIISPHRFRHTVATHMMQSPERNLYIVKRLLGHASITSTLEYIDESVDNLRDILEAELM
ncbi:ArdC-like ssDNA-binding domain-containing protein [Proteus vulgaris]|uniref:ArdC-like ssDNA-binding domain-containing protein n=1 Tax=Proteus vulgaris TaxID=585 RepID=UPI0021B0A3D4|nr:ArdC-like ssDNA-binding domain-containing protein [Proteus vulgaris]MCT6518402.1 ArdC-like ssDNA-binding domain-containing protein [Proteus vulgaris]